AAARGQHQHRNCTLLSQLLEDIKTTHPRQHHVENNDRRMAGERLLQAAGTIVSGFQPELLALQILFEQLAQLGVVVDEQDRSHSSETIYPARKHDRLRNVKCISPEFYNLLPPAPALWVNTSGRSNVVRGIAQNQQKAAVWDFKRSCAMRKKFFI